LFTFIDKDPNLIHPSIFAIWEWSVFCNEIYFKLNRLGEKTFYKWKSQGGNSRLQTLGVNLESSRVMESAVSPLENHHQWVCFCLFSIDEWEKKKCFCLWLKNVHDFFFKINLPKVNLLNLHYHYHHELYVKMKLMMRLEIEMNIEEMLD